MIVRLSGVLLALAPVLAHARTSLPADIDPGRTGADHHHQAGVGSGPSPMSRPLCPHLQIAIQRLRKDG
jgi:hypothetical protein